MDPWTFVLTRDHSVADSSLTLLALWTVYTYRSLNMKGVVGCPADLVGRFRFRKRA